MSSDDRNHQESEEELEDLLAELTDALMQCLEDSNIEKISLIDMETIDES